MNLLLIALALYPGQKPKSPATHPRPKPALTQPNIKKTFQATYDRMYAAFNKRDAAGFLEQFAPDFTSTGQSGKKMGREEVRGSLDAMFRLAKDVNASATVQSVSTSGKKATAIVKLLVKVVVVDPRNNKELKRGQETVSRDEWDKSSGKWLLQGQAKVSARTL